MTQIDFPELRGETPDPLSRRGFVKVGLSAGFCAAVSPVWGQVITTPADGLVAGEVKIKTSDVEIPAYRAQPEGARPFPVVVAISKKPFAGSPSRPNCSRGRATPPPKRTCRS